MNVFLYVSIKMFYHSDQLRTHVLSMFPQISLMHTDIRFVLNTNLPNSTNDVKGSGGSFLHYRFPTDLSDLHRDNHKRKSLLYCASVSSMTQSTYNVLVRSLFESEC